VPILDDLDAIPWDRLTMPTVLARIQGSLEILTPLTDSDV
jgi:hypothetical protein